MGSLPRPSRLLSLCDHGCLVQAPGGKLPGVFRSPWYVRDDCHPLQEEAPSSFDAILPLHGYRPRPDYVVILADRVIALPQFANSIQRGIEVLIETKVGKIENIEVRPAHSRFDEDGKIDLGHTAEAMAIILAGSAPQQIGENLLDIRPTLIS
jgi:hypothetical protein